MSECYFIDGDTLQPILFGNETAQTFSPLEDHTLDYFDIEADLPSIRGIPYPHLYLSDSSHEPIGGTVSHTTSLIYKTPFQPGLQRLRAMMQPYPLQAGHIYCLKIYGLGDTPEYIYKWQYDSSGSAYPRGHRIWRNNGTDPWTHYTDQDYMFCEVGKPPIPALGTLPPIENFATAAITYLHSPTAIKITLATSVPCHLTCYWTDIHPRKHHTTRIYRGLETMDNTYFCFVAWHEVEQNEPGDTVYHTFDITPWEYCQTRWFTFRGEVDNIESPSVGPIFSHHHDGTLATAIFNVSQRAYYRVFRSANPGDPDVLYTLAHDQWQANSYHTTVIQYGQRIRIVGTYAAATIKRTAINFNTSTLPPSTLLKATLRLDIRKVSPPLGFFANWDWYLKIRAGHDLNTYIIHRDLFNYSGILNLGTEIASKYANNLPDPGYQDYWYIDVPLQYINKTGRTVFTSLTSKDEASTRPAGNNIEEALFIADSFSQLEIEYLQL